MSGHNITVHGTLNFVGGNQTNIGVPHLEPAGMSIPGLLIEHTGTTTATGRLITSAPSISGNRPVPRLTPLFTGRKDILKQLAVRFDPTQPSITLKLQRVFVLYGPGGSGKTQIMAKFVNEFSERFSGVYYVDGSTLETIKASLEDIARYTSAGDTSEDALRWFTQRRTEWLLLIDNADDPEINLRQFLPACSHGNIIVTSRNRACRQHAPDSNCNVVGMEPDEAIELLLKSSMAERSTRNRGLCASICEELGYFALAVAQAGAYIAQSCTLDSYLELYYEDRVQLLQKRPVQTADDYQLTVYTSWEMSLKKLSPMATMFLRLCAFMHHEGISRDIFKSAATANHPPESFEDGHRFLNNFRSTNGKWSNEKFLDIVNELASYSLINVDTENNTYSIHPLIHAWACKRANASEYQVARTCTLQILALSVPDGYDAESYALRRSLLPHLDVARSGDLQLDIVERLENVYMKCGRWKTAGELRTLIVKTKVELLGEENPDTVQSMVGLVVPYLQEGRWKEAEELGLQMMLMTKRLLGDEHPSTIVAMGNLSYTYRNQGRWKDAEELDLQVMSMAKRVLGDEHPDTIVAMSNLASTYWNQGRWKDAEELELQVMSMRKRVLGDEHPSTILTMNNLACTYWKQGRWKDAEELELQVMSMRKRVLGDEHPSTILTMNNLASTYWNQGRWKDAEELELQVMSMRKRLLGDEHPSTIVAMGNLSYTYRNQGRWKDAEELNLQVMSMAKRVLGDEHPDTIVAMSNLALTYRRRRRWKQARELDLRVLMAQRRLLGNDHPDVLASIVHLASTYTTKQRLLAWLRHLFVRS